MITRVSLVLQLPEPITMRPRVAFRDRALFFIEPRGVHRRCLASEPGIGYAADSGPGGSPGEPVRSCMTGSSGHGVRSDRGSYLVPEASCRRRENATGRLRCRRSSMRLVLAIATSASNGA